MTKDEVFVILKSNILNQLEDEIQESEITYSKSLTEIGANSLDIVEILSNTMRELKIKIPREELTQIKTIEDFVKKLTDFKNV